MIGSDGGARINFLYTNIGRGHPHYLDGIIERLEAQRLGQVADVFTLASGASLAAWRLVRLLYRTAGSHGATAYLYNRLRSHSDYNRLGIVGQVLAGPVRRRFLSDGTPLVVAHPLLVAALRDKPGLMYQHGEFAAPRESLVRGRHSVFVPTTHTADAFMAAGIAPAQILVSELCIEPGLVAQAEAAFETRLRRISGSEPLCGGFLPSGAEPRLHVERLAAAALAVARRGGRAFLFASEGGRFAAHAVAKFSEARFRLRKVRSVQAIHDRTQSCVLCIYRNRRELNQLTLEAFPEFDYFVSAAHERTSWALGLGLPMLVVGPSLGSFAPHNRELLLKRGVGQAIGSLSEAAQIGHLIERLRRSGSLARMAESGWGRFGIGGFGNIARVLSGL
jgi:hypothetical protein